MVPTSYRDLRQPHTMLIILSPAKTLDFQKQQLTKRTSTPLFQDEATTLIDVLRQQSPKQLAKLMNVSNELAETTHQQFAAWSTSPKPANAKQAILAYRGNAYVGLNADAYKAADFTFAQKSLRILSGLYGVLRPLDLIQPYRLEMQTKLRTPGGKNLYEFWGTQITDALKKDLAKQKKPTLMNLASGEYFKSIQKKELEADIITANFKEDRNGTYKSISAFAKKARGLLASYIIHNKLTDANDVRSFNEEGYRYNSKLSSDNDWIFTRAT